MTETEEIFEIKGKMGFYLTHCIIPTMEQELAIREIINKGFIPVIILTNLDPDTKSGYTFEERYEMVSRLASFYCDRFLVMAIRGYPESFQELEIFRKILRGELDQGNLKMTVQEAALFIIKDDLTIWWKPLRFEYEIKDLTYHEKLNFHMDERRVLEDIVENQCYIHPVVLAELIKITRTRLAKEIIN